MKTPTYTINEPHPTVSKNAYMHSGRGGAGNTFRVAETTSPSGVPTVARPAPQQSTRFFSGRGGAGNVHAPAERDSLNFDEEFLVASQHAKQSSGHVGRGGAGNIFGEAKKERKHSSSRSDTSSRRDSSSTNGSIRSGFWGRLSGASLGNHH